MEFLPYGATPLTVLTTLQSHVCSVHELYVSPRPHRLPGDSQVCGGHKSSLLTCLPSCRYAIPPEHGKRLERLAIGRCLRPRAGVWDLGLGPGAGTWAGRGGVGGVGKQQSSFPVLLCVGFQFLGVARCHCLILPFSCTPVIRSVVHELGGLSLHGFCTECIALNTLVFRSLRMEFLDMTTGSRGQGEQLCSVSAVFCPLLSLQVSVQSGNEKSVRSTLTGPQSEWWPQGPCPFVRGSDSPGLPHQMSLPAATVSPSVFGSLLGPHGAHRFV